MDRRIGLLLCDDEEVHDLAACWLTTAGFRVISARDGKDVESTVSRHSVDVLIIDTLPIYLPDLPSLRVLKKQSQRLRILLIPRLNEGLEIGIARISGVDVVLMRPMRRAAVLSALNA